MIQEIMSYIIMIWIGFSILIPLAILFFAFIFLIPQIFSSFKYLQDLSDRAIKTLITNFYFVAYLKLQLEFFHQNLDR